MNLIKRYHQLVTEGKLVPDKSQKLAIAQLKAVRDEFIDSKPAGEFKNLISTINKSKQEK